MDVISLLKALPEQIQRIIIYSYLPRHNCATLLLTPSDPFRREIGAHNTITLKYVYCCDLKQKYKSIIWEELRPSNLKKITYGDSPDIYPQRGWGGQFLIFRECRSPCEMDRYVRSLT